MKISARFAEYSLTGAFFWASQFLILMIQRGNGPGDISKDWAAAISQLAAVVPVALQNATNALLTATGLIVIVSTGLLLDLFGSYFVMWELIVFRSYVHRNRDWLDELAVRYRRYLAKDYAAFANKFTSPWDKREWLAAWYVLTPFTGRRRREAYRALRRIGERFAVIGPYSRLHSFMVSFIMVFSGAAKLDVLVDAVYLWRVSRSVTNAMLIFSLELYVTLFFKLFSDTADGGPSFSGLLSAICLVAAILLLAWFMTRQAYSRMCATIFSLAYATDEKIKLLTKDTGTSLAAPLHSQSPLAAVGAEVDEESEPGADGSSE